MKLQDTQITNYLTFCKTQKCLDEKTIRAYKIDLTQFSSSMSAETSLYDITSRQLEAYIAHLHSIYKLAMSKTPHTQYLCMFARHGNLFYHSKFIVTTSSKWYN